MKIVIDIPNGAYDELTTGTFPIQDSYRLVAWVMNGTKLPEVHGDLISRQAVIDTLNRLIEVERKQGTDVMNYGRERVNAYESILDEIESDYLFPSMPSAEKIARWIPVSKRLPEKLKDVLVAFYDCPGEYDVAYLRTTFNETYKKNGAKNEWVSSMGETTYADYEVDAWMPIEPYKESEE